MALSLSIKHRLLLSHLFAVVVLAGAFGAFVYYMAAQQVVERMRAQLANSVTVLAQSFNAGTLEAATRDPAAQRALVARLQSAARENADISLIYVTHRDGNADSVLAGSDAAAVSSAMAGDQDDGRLLAQAAVPGADGYAVGMQTRADTVGDTLYILRLSAALAFLVCVLAALVLSRHLARRFQISITDLAARCRALANGEPLPPRRHAGRDELDDLAREFDAMAGRLRNAAEGRERASIALREANEHLESRVSRRTAELEGATIKLRNEIESRVHVEALLAEAALTDPLTGLLNRRAMMEMLGQASVQLRSGEPGLSVIVTDIDHFKRVNDLHGHASGDQVLIAVASRLREFSGDQQQHNVARWGGEEFLILLPSVRLAAACKRAEQLRRQVAELRIGTDGLRVTLSLGVAELLAGEPLADCLRRCDQALYRAKDAGRDTVVAAQGALFATMS
ncbi:MAG: diguanylate cyclase [Rudaea sp.]|nr:diguanylate cyclase [Rudaea sp.]